VFRLPTPRYDDHSAPAADAAEEEMKRMPHPDDPLITAFGQTLTLGEWAAHPRCRVSELILARRRAEGWDFEFALVTDEPAKNKTTADRMDEVRQAAPGAATVKDIARLLDLTGERIRQLLDQMPDGDKIRKDLAAEQQRQREQRAATRNPPRPARVPFRPPQDELAELLTLAASASKVRGGDPPDSPRRQHSVRRDQIVSRWQQQGASLAELAELAGVSNQTIQLWLSPAQSQARAAKAIALPPFRPPQAELAELLDLIAVAAGTGGAPGSQRRRNAAQAAARRNRIVGRWKKQGASTTEIGRLAGVPGPTVANWLNPKKAKTRETAAGATR
jgi:lambda repressor-like predicted transcriptional regulator